VDVPEEILPLLSGGEFELCLELLATRRADVTVDRLTLRYVTDDDLSGFTCEQIFALPDVQNALETLDDNELEFTLYEGDSPDSIEGTYRMTDRVLFDPDDTDTDGVITGTITFSNQGQGTVERGGFDATIEQAIQGATDTVSVCVLGRSNNAECDQTIARMESLAWSEEEQAWDGTYLAVVVERHTSTESWCGEAGDFNFGEILFRPSDASTNGVADGETITP
jgi:hypothetical protein